jgi:hypothetical protein
VLASLYVIAIFPTGVQISVAVADPVPVGVLSASQLILTFAGQVITGAVISCTVIVWMHSLKFPVTSVALHVLVIV